MPRVSSVLPACALAASAAAQCLTLGTFVARGNLPTNLPPPGAASEVSGMAASRHNPGILWIHDDGAAGGAQVIALRTDGSLAQIYTMPGVTNRDWEDMAVGPGPTPGRDWLYLAETGNNALGYVSFALIRVAEPDVPRAPQAAIPLTAERFAFRYPSGTFNTETLWIDPFDGVPYLLTKENSATCRLFRYPLPLDAAVEKTLEPVATLTGMPPLFTGGAQSADGRWILARTTTAILAWERPTGTTFASAFGRSPCRFTHVQGQAEAIAFDADGRSLWAISEGIGAPIQSSPVSFPGGVPVRYAFGTGLAGAAGVPGLATLQVPRLGGPPLELAGWQVSTNAPTLALLSVRGYPDGVIPFAGGWLHADADVMLAAVASAAGTVALPLGPLPDHPLLYGASLSGQMFAVDATAPQGIALSAGLRLVLDR
jgi:hypothetical protein